MSKPVCRGNPRHDRSARRCRVCRWDFQQTLMPAGLSPLAPTAVLELHMYNESSNQQHGRPGLVGNTNLQGPPGPTRQATLRRGYSSIVLCPRWAAALLAMLGRNSRNSVDVTHNPWEIILLGGSVYFHTSVSPPSRTRIHEQNHREPNTRLYHENKQKQKQIARGGE
jgi:hypothetical protein